jgi:hypothetical protein
VSAETNTVFELMRLEFDRLQASIDKFDDQRFKIKGWAITAAGALFAVAVNVHESVLAIAGAVLVLFFGYLEVVYMNMELHAIRRCNDVEALMNRAATGLPPKNDEYIFGLGQTFAFDFHVRLIPEILHKRHYITAFYVGLVLAMVIGGLLIQLTVLAGNGP